MTVLIDGQELPAGVEVELAIRPDQPTVHIRFPVDDQALMSALAPLTDDQVHTFEWRSGETLVAQAHGKLQGRLQVRTGSGPSNAIYELWGQVWGPPPNYNRILVVTGDGAQ